MSADSRIGLTVACLRLSQASGDSHTDISADGYKATNATLKMLIKDAYGIRTGDLIQGLPGWTDSLRFDVEAKIDEPAAAALQRLSREEQTERRRQMLQSLLEDRFKLKTHRESRQIAIYQLEFIEGKLRLKLGQPSPTSVPITVKPGVISGQGVSISTLADALSSELDRVVEDETGMTGIYDLDLHWSGNVSTAVRDQLGLSLVSTKAPMNVTVVDHVDRPATN